MNEVRHGEVAAPACVIRQRVINKAGMHLDGLECSSAFGCVGHNVMRVDVPMIVFDHTLGNAPHPVPNCEAKPQWAHLVLGWGTTRESCGVVRVFFVFLFCFCSDVSHSLAL